MSEIGAATLVGTSRLKLQIASNSNHALGPFVFQRGSDVHNVSLGTSEPVDISGIGEQDVSSTDYSLITIARTIDRGVVLIMRPSDIRRRTSTRGTKR